MMLQDNNKDLGNYSSEVPPPFLFRWEVKPVHADGTAVTCGRVGSRLLRVLRAIGGLFFVRERDAGEDGGEETERTVSVPDGT